MGSCNDLVLGLYMRLTLRVKRNPSVIALNLFGNLFKYGDQNNDF